MTDTIEGMLKDFEHGLYDKTDNGRCVGCGECCSNLLPMQKKEINIIRQYIKTHGIKEQKLPSVYAKQPYDLTCPFLRKDVSKDRCVIYPIRPSICKQFKCDKARNGEQFQGSMEDYILIDVRETFFGGQNGKI